MSKRTTNKNIDLSSDDTSKTDISEKYVSDTENDTENDTDSEDEIKMKNRLTNKDYQITTYTVRSIFTDFLEEENIILRPSYQRALTWSYDKMNYFLDSLFYFPIVPSFIICQIDKEELKEIRKKDKNSPLKYECIDGQHRLTVIHHYLKGKPIEINGKTKMLYIEEVKDNSKKNKNMKIFYKLTPEIEKKITDSGINKKDIRAMTTDERYAFNDTQLSFISIQKQIDKHTKCNLFNRLQQGERANCGTMTKNSDHPISNYIRDNNVITQDNYDKNWKCILSHPRIKDYKYDELLNRMTFLIIRLLYITDKKSLEVNYNDSNMASYIRENYRSSYLSDNTQIDKIYKKIVNINSIIQTNIKELKITEEFYYLIHKLFMDASPLIQNIALFLNNKEFNKKYNNILFYKKSVNSKIVGSDMTKKYNELIKDLTDFSTENLNKKGIPHKIIIDKIDFKDKTESNSEDENIIVKPKKRTTVKNYDDLNI